MQDASNAHLHTPGSTSRVWLYGVGVGGWMGVLEQTTLRPACGSTVLLYPGEQYAVSGAALSLSFCSTVSGLDLQSTANQH